MTIDFGHLQLLFFGLFFFLLVLRIAAFTLSRGKSQHEAERITQLEQKVDAILRRLDMQNAPTSHTSNPFSSPMINSAPISDEVVHALRLGNKIEAIKIYRQQTGVDLRAAKEAVEEIAKRL